MDVYGALVCILRSGHSQGRAETPNEPSDRYTEVDKIPESFLLHVCRSDIWRICEDSSGGRRYSFG